MLSTTIKDNAKLMLPTTIKNNTKSGERKKKLAGGPPAGLGKVKKYKIVIFHKVKKYKIVIMVIKNDF